MGGFSSFSSCSKLSDWYGNTTRPFSSIYKWKKKWKHFTLMFSWGSFYQWIDRQFALGLCISSGCHQTEKNCCGGFSGLHIFLCGVCMFFLCLFAFFGFASFLPQSKKMHVRLIGNSELSMDVNVSVLGCLCPCPLQWAICLLRVSPCLYLIKACQAPADSWDMSFKRQVLKMDGRIYASLLVTYGVTHSSLQVIITC